MAVTSESTTVWTGDLKSGSGTVSLDSSGAASLAVNWKARSEGGAETSTPEELLGAAHSACFSMAFSNVLAGFGTPPESIRTTAAVTFDPAQGIDIRLPLYERRQTLDHRPQHRHRRVRLLPGDLG